MSAMIATFTIPWPPTVNHTYRPTGHGGSKVLTRGARSYRTLVRMEVMRLRVAGTLPPEPLRGRLGVWIVAAPPDRRARDLDNLGKATLDALEKAGVFDNDNQIDDLRFRRGQPTPGGQLVVSIYDESALRGAEVMR